MRRLVMLLLVLALALALAPVATAQDSPVIAYRQGDGSLVALNVLPPGQGRYLNSAEALEAQTTGNQPERNTNQIDMYDRLVQAAPTLTADDLTTYFKDASFGVRPDDVKEEYSPRDGLVVQRDQFGVPHVHGRTREDTMFGSGYVSAEDRFFMMDVLRHLGRGRSAELLGASQANLAMDRAQFAFADYTDEELEALADRLVEIDPELGPVVRSDLDAYIAGINAYVDEMRTDPSKLPAEYAALQIVPRHFTIADVVAAATMIGASLGAGGGAELRNALFLDALEEEGYTPEEARAIFDDFRLADDPEAPTKTRTRFTWSTTELGPVDAAAVARPDAGSLIDNPGGSPLDELLGFDPPTLALDGPFGPIPLALPDGASNALLVGADLSATGRPIAVYGPQVGYWSPQILMEIGMYGPGVAARGAAFPGLSMYVLLGRGATTAWSATSAGGDQVDYWAQELCEPDGGNADLDSDHYVNVDGECVEMYTRSESFLAPPSAAGIPDSPTTDSIVVTRTTQRTDLGIVHARATVDGTPVAYVAQRSSYGAEVDSALAYVRSHDPDRVRTVADAIDAFDRFSYTFNWFFLDHSSIGWVMGGYHPDRAPGVDPDLPNWGRAQWTWRSQDVPLSRTPHEIDPAHGYITSWNNKQAPGWRSNDGQGSWGPVHRSQPLDDRIDAAVARDGEIDLVGLVQAMADAGTVDIRGDKLVPLLLDVIGQTGDARLDRATALLAEWNAAGAHRRDLTEDGSYDHAAAVALMDAWWDLVLDAAFEPVLQGALREVPQGRDNPPGPVGSAYIGGWYGQLHKDLRAVLGRQVVGPLSRSYCGEGDLPACQESLIASLDAAISALEDEFGEDPGSWEADEDGDRIQFAALGLQGQRSMQWQNRPTFQQVLEFAAPDDETPDDTPAPVLPATGGGTALAALLVLLAAVALGLGGRRTGVGAGAPDAGGEVVRRRARLDAGGPTRRS